MRGAYRVLVGRTEGKTPLGIPTCRWEDNIEMDLHVGWGTMVAQWLWCCATNWKAAGSIPVGVSGFFY